MAVSYSAASATTDGVGQVQVQAGVQGAYGVCLVEDVWVRAAIFELIGSCLRAEVVDHRSGVLASQFTSSDVIEFGEAQR
ncbi:hypothetical protein [Nocardia fluminea]|uniref:hypothetical protein n=1 Tax=Nocardia fluminea TaxID=134984 RepID=UPI0033C9AA59